MLLASNCRLLIKYFWKYLYSYVADWSDTHTTQNKAGPEDARRKKICFIYQASVRDALAAVLLSEKTLVGLNCTI